jgi:hypothetical protein
MTSTEFNEEYPVGKIFIYQPNRFLRGGKIVRTVARANNADSGLAIVEINVDPWFVDIATLTPSN